MSMCRSSAHWNLKGLLCRCLSCISSLPALKHSHIERFNHVIKLYILEINHHLGVQLVQYVIVVYAILIKKPTGKHLYSCFNLCSNGILSDSTHIRSIISISLIS